MALNTNGQARKSLASQIDRLDSMLDGLSENLNDAVAMAVKEAVKAVMTELLTNPHLAAKLQTALGRMPEQPKPVATDRPSTIGTMARYTVRVLRTGTRKLGQVAMGLMASVASWCWSVYQRVAAPCTRVCKQFCAAAQSTWTLLQAVRPLALPLLTALAIGIGVAVATFHAGPWLAAVVSGMGSFVIVLVIQVGLWLWQALVPNRLSSDYEP